MPPLKTLCLSSVCFLHLVGVRCAVVVFTKEECSVCDKKSYTTAYFLGVYNVQSTTFLDILLWKKPWINIFEFLEEEKKTCVTGKEVLQKNVRMREKDVKLYDVNRCRWFFQNLQLSSISSFVWRNGCRENNEYNQVRKVEVEIVWHRILNKKGTRWVTVNCYDTFRCRLVACIIITSFEVWKWIYGFIKCSNI